MTCRPHPSEDQARTAPSPSTPREQVAPKHGLTITIPIPKDALSSRPKYRYISPTQLAHSFPLASNDFTQARERRRRAMEYSASSAGTFSVEDRKGSNTFSLPFFSPPHPPTLSIPSFAGSSERPLPPSLTNSAEFTLTVHQATPLYPGDTFSFIVEVKYPTTDLHPTLSLSFSAHSFFDSSPSDAQGGPITHHTLFNQIKRIPLPISANSSLTLPFSTTIPLGAECETCSSHYAISPPSLRVEDPGGRLRARVSYELMATWGEKVAVAEVQVAQRREIVEEALSRGVWVKLEGEKEMQGGWEGWDLERVEVSALSCCSNLSLTDSSTSPNHPSSQMSYHLPSQPPIDLLFALKSSLRLLPLHYNDPAPLLTLLSRLSTDHSHLALYEVLVGPAGPVRVTRTWDSKKSAHELQVEVNTFARRGGEGATEERGVDLRRTFKLEDVPFTSFTPASSCIGWRMEVCFPCPRCGFFGCPSTLTPPLLCSTASSSFSADSTNPTHLSPTTRFASPSPLFQVLYPYPGAREATTCKRTGRRWTRWSAAHGDGLREEAGDFGGR